MDNTLQRRRGLYLVTPILIVTLLSILNHQFEWIGFYSAGLLSITAVMVHSIGMLIAFSKGYFLEDNEKLTPEFRRVFGLVFIFAILMIYPLFINWERFFGLFE